MSYSHDATKVDAASLQQRILGIIEVRVGAAQAIRARDIATLLGRSGRYSDRPIREAIKTLRREGHLILSSVGKPPGYFLAETAEEWVKFRDGNLRPRALDILETSSAMTKAAALCFEPDLLHIVQLTLMAP